MSNEMPPSGEDVLPVVDEVLAGALLNQGAQGARALGLVRDAHRILSGASGLERPGEIVEACVRSAADALLKLPGAPKNPAGLQSAARDLLDAVDAALPAPAAAPAAVTDAGWERYGTRPRCCAAKYTTRAATGAVRRGGSPSG